MLRCARARKRPSPDSENKFAQPCRTLAPNGALKGRPECPRRSLMVDSDPKLRDVFSNAMQCQTPKEQAAYLEQVCQGDAELRARLDELLQAHREAGSFLQEASAASTPTLAE